MDVEDAALYKNLKDFDGETALSDEESIMDQTKNFNGTIYTAFGDGVSQSSSYIESVNNKAIFDPSTFGNLNIEAKNEGNYENRENEKASIRSIW